MPPGCHTGVGFGVLVGCGVGFAGGGVIIGLPPPPPGVVGLVGVVGFGVCVAVGVGFAGLVGEVGVVGVVGVVGFPPFPLQPCAPALLHASLTAASASTMRRPFWVNAVSISICLVSAAVSWGLVDRKSVAIEAVTGEEKEVPLLVVYLLFPAESATGTSSPAAYTSGQLLPEKNVIFPFLSTAPTEITLSNNVEQCPGVEGADPPWVWA